MSGIKPLPFHPRGTAVKLFLAPIAHIPRRHKFTRIYWLASIRFLLQLKGPPIQCPWSSIPTPNPDPQKWKALAENRTGWRMGSSPRTGAGSSRWISSNGLREDFPLTARRSSKASHLDRSLPQLQRDRRLLPGRAAEAGAGRVRVRFGKLLPELQRWQLARRRPREALQQEFRVSQYAAPELALAPLHSPPRWMLLIDDYYQERPSSYWWECGKLGLRLIWEDNSIYSLIEPQA